MGKGEIVEGEGFEKRPGFMGNFGDWTANTLLLSHGLELWALASHYRITRDQAWLEGGKRPPLQAMLDACDWLVTQRRRTMREENGQKVRHWGLLPAASTHDWLQGNTIANDATCIYGMIETVRMLREIEHPRAGEMAKELNDYRSCLRDRYVEARDRARRVPMADGADIPYVPRDVYELDWAQTDWTYTCVGPGASGSLGRARPDDEMVDQSLAFIDAGLPQGPGLLSADSPRRLPAQQRGRKFPRRRRPRRFPPLLLPALRGIRDHDSHLLRPLPPARRSAAVFRMAL